MIFSLNKSNNGKTVIVFNNTNDAWDAYHMMDKAFPYSHASYQSTGWIFFICCYGGYENAIIFGE